MTIKSNSQPIASPIYVFGNTFGSMVAVSELKKAKKEFLWVQDGCNVDGVWRGLSYNDRILDLGMINFEFDVRHPEPAADLTTYSQYQINDCARFSDYVLDFINQHTSIKELPKIMICENGKIYNDHLLSNNFSQLSRFQKLNRGEIENPLEMHPSKKYTAKGKEMLLDISYEEYVKKYFGDTLGHSLFLSWASKLVGKNVANANTFRHRAAWLPLPYPETIYEAVSESAKEDHSYSFHYPTEITFSEFVNFVFTELNNDPEIKKIQSSELNDGDLKQILVSDSVIFWGSKLEAFLKVNEQYSMYELEEFRNRINVDVYEVILETGFEGYVYLNNDLEDDDWYRLTVLPNVVFDDGLQIAIVESRESKNELLYSDFFAKLGIKLVNCIKSIRGIPVFLTLNGEQYRKYESWHQLLSNDFPNLTFGGGASFAYAATFSDQIVQGLNFARKVSEDVGK